MQVLLNAKAEGVFNSTLEVFTKGGATSHLSVAAAITAPNLALTPTLLDLGVTHLGVPRVCDLTLSNLTMLPTSFTWEAYGSGGEGVQGGEMSVVMDPVRGVLEPGQAAVIIHSSMSVCVHVCVQCIHMTYCDICIETGNLCLDLARSQCYF